jgi:tRNA threonylcarbamoyladenosine biosynthesis protein TsaE
MTDRFLADTDATLAAGRELAAQLRPGDVVALTGGLGAGKTHFTMGLVRGLGGSDDVTSPTFTLVHEYRGGRLPVFHFDFYRMDSPAEVTAIGWDEYLDSGGVCVVEWADRFPELLPEGTQWWSLTVDGSGRRLRRIKSPVHG